MIWNDGIIPATSSETGNFIVAIHSISHKFTYKAVMKKHLDSNVIGWFLQRGKYTPQELINGIKRELDYVNSDEGVAYRCNRNPYPSALEISLELMRERYSMIDFPEYYI